MESPSLGVLQNYGDAALRDVGSGGHRLMVGCDDLRDLLQP